MTSTPQNTHEVPKEVQVAKISARQAIAVALITSIAGLVGAGIGIGLKTSSASAPGMVHRISVEGVDYQECRDRCAIRVVTEVNGQAYSYPSRVVWADIGPSMSKEQFPLVSSPEFAVNITAFLRYPDGHIELLRSQVLNRDSAAALPVEREYRLFPVDGGFTRGATDRVTVHYRIE